LQSDQDEVYDSYSTKPRDAVDITGTAAMEEAQQIFSLCSVIVSTLLKIIIKI
jgi:hypothetical protein